MEIGIRLETKKFFIYFHRGVEIEFADETLLDQLFGPEISIAQVDVYIDDFKFQIATIVGIQSETNVEILEESGKLTSLKDFRDVDLKPIGGWVSFLIHIYSKVSIIRPSVLGF